jgi:dTDP-4-amino-4,6-dideoxygalactose transaminase
LSNPAIVEDFEQSFAAAIGVGSAASFASGRMAFYSLLKTLTIGHGDEVILPGFTCSVMVNAVLRTGATPVFSDIAESTFGSAPESIAAALTGRTRMIVAQHSFGYPCDITTIRALADDAGVFVLEDCATSFGSRVAGTQIGNFGHAALFSTDHTKPLNTLVGGLIYSLDHKLTADVKALANASPDLPLNKQTAIWERLQSESRHRSPDDHRKLFTAEVIAGPLSRLTHPTSPFLTEDYLPTASEGTYPYPARMPTFVASLGEGQLQAWPRLRSERVAALAVLLAAVRATPSGQYLPAVLNDHDVDIVPLRVAWAQPDGARIRHLLRRFTTSDAAWFMSPIVATSAPAEDFGYRWGSCPVAEALGPMMVNLPIPETDVDAMRLAQLVQSALNSP